jgi:hypothetical protein
VKNFEISDTKQKDMMKHKDQVIKMGEDKQALMVSEANEALSKHNMLIDEQKQLQERNK